MIKVCWISAHMESPEAFLKSILKMTPNRSGKWKDMVSVTNPFDADYCFIMDSSPFPIPMERSIFFAEHPKCLPSFDTFEKIKDKALCVLPLDKHLNPGEWWIDYDYDFLSNLKPMDKTRGSICVCTAKLTPWKMYSDRVKFLEALLPRYSKVDIFGRPASNYLSNHILKNYFKGELGVSKPNGKLGEHMTGKEIIQHYRYTIEFDNGPTQNYFSERIYDSLLMWCLPLCWGSNNIHEFLPENSFRYVDIENYSSGEITKAIDVLESNFREYHIKDIEIARDLMLNKYQMFPYMYNVIKNLDKFKTTNNAIKEV